MHNGRIATMTDAVLWYRTGNPQRSTENLDRSCPSTSPQALHRHGGLPLQALTDPRVAAETFPFDRPTLHGGNLPVLNVGADHATFSWPALTGVSRYNVYRGTLADLRTLGPDGLPARASAICVSATDPNTADTVFVDTAVPRPGDGLLLPEGRHRRPRRGARARRDQRRTPARRRRALPSGILSTVSGRRHAQHPDPRSRGEVRTNVACVDS